MSDQYWTGAKAQRYAREFWGLKISHWMSIDFDADMGYVRIREHGTVYRTDTSLQDHGVLLDRGVNDELLGIELFLRKGNLRDATCAELVRLLAKERRAVP